MLVNRYYEWLRRSIGVVGGVRVGAPGELWRVVPKHPANEWILEMANADGQNYGDSDVAYYTCRTLVRDVLRAAGAIEYTVRRIEAAAASVQAYAEKHSIASESEDVPMSLVTPEVDDAYIEYANLLNWLRTLSDRMRSRDPFAHATLGLIPALSPEMPLRREVETIFERFDRDAVIAGEAFITNFGLHLHALPGADSGSAVMTTDGRARLLIPDKPSERLYLFDQFTYGEQRELVGFAHDVLDRVASFVDELLTAFEAGTEYAMSKRAER
jgi:hypothetical protein